MVSTLAPHDLSSSLRLVYSFSSIDVSIAISTTKSEDEMTIVWLRQERGIRKIDLDLDTQRARLIQGPVHVGTSSWRKETEEEVE